jgi:glycosyltransferase involved in cell wall biosynthesis
MTIIQITPGAGAMYCGLCIRDNALVAILRRMGHQVVMVPLYLPFTLDEADQSANTPIFFSGINVYLEQKSTLFRKAPKWFHDLFTSRSLLKWVAGKAARTRAEDLGDLTLSMLRGEEGNQARELDQLIAWLKTQPRPDVICLSTALLIGLARRLKTELNCPVVCQFQGEDYFLDALAEPARAACWQTLAERAAEVALFVAPTKYFGELMCRRLSLPAEKMRVSFNGINLSGYAEGAQSPESKVQSLESASSIQQLASRTDPSAAETSPHASRLTPNAQVAPRSDEGGSPSLGYFARMCKEKGLDTLVEAYIALRQRGRAKDLKLRIGGGCGPADEPFVNALRERLSKAGFLGEVTFHPNLDRAAKLEFLRSLSVFSVPALYGEAFGLYVIEALASGVPVVQPRTGAFPELIEATGGGVLCAPGDAQALAGAIEELLLNPDRARALGDAGRRAVREKFSAEAMARETVGLLEEMCSSSAS